MDHLVGSGQREYRPQSDFLYSSGEGRDYSRLSPKQKDHRANEYRPETEYHTHTFQKNQRSSKPIRNNSNRNLPPKYLQIKPYLDNILSDQVTENKEVQRNLKDLKSLNQRLLQDLGESGVDRQQPSVKGTYWDQIQKLINQIINNSENETSEFKASLQHLKNIKDKTLQQDLNYYQNQQNQYSYDRGRGSRRPTYQSNPRSNYQQAALNRPFSQNFHPQTENQRRLLDEIIGLRQQNRQLRYRVNKQIDKNRYLSNKLRDFQDDSYDAIGARRVDDRSREEYGDDDLKEHLNRLNQRVRDANISNNNLRKELKDLKPNRSNNYRGTSKDVKNHIRELETHVRASQRRANNYQNIKLNQQTIINQLNKLKYENNELRSDTVQLLKAKSQPRYKTYSEVEDPRITKLQNSLAQHNIDYRREGGKGYRNTSKYY